VAVLARASTTRSVQPSIDFGEHVLYLNRTFLR